VDEPAAEPVGDKTRANLCGWFRPQTGLRPGQDTADDDARHQLEDLFR